MRIQRRDVAKKVLAQPGAETCARSRRIVRQHVGPAMPHAGFEVGVQVVHLAQQVDARDALAHLTRQGAQGLRQRANGLLAPLGNGVVGAGNAPGVERPAHVPVHRQRALRRVGHVGRVLCQRRLDGRMFGKVRREQVQHHRAIHALHRVRDAPHGLRVHHPATGARLEQIEQGHQQRVAQLEAPIGAAARADGLQRRLDAGGGRAVLAGTCGLQRLGGRGHFQAVAQFADGRRQQQRLLPPLPQPARQRDQRRQQCQRQRKAEQIEATALAQFTTHFIAPGIQHRRRSLSAGTALARRCR